MDSLTQMTLGAAVGEAVLGRKVGNKAVLWGAVCGTFPDLDVFIPFGDPVRDFTFHRSFSHSVFVLALLTPFLVWLICKIHPQASTRKKRWFILVWLVFMTHILLDCFTVYGTQVFWPLWNYPVGWGTIFIIDPLYSLPLIIGVIGALVMTRENARGHMLNRVGLVLSSVYLAWSVGAKLYVRSAVQQDLGDLGITYEHLLVSAGPFNTALWRVVVMQRNGGYHEGYFSLLDNHDGTTFTSFRSRNDLLEGLDGHWPLQRLQWFTKGFYKVSRKEGKVVISDLRMGYEPDYVFSYVVGEVDGARVVPVPSKRVRPQRDLGHLFLIWERIWSAGKKQSSSSRVES